MQLESLNIDKYIDWYKRLSEDLFIMDLMKEKRNRLLIAAFRLRSRFVLNNKNKKSLDCSTKFREVAKELETKIKNVERWQVADIYFIPSLINWNEFDLFRKNGLKIFLEELKERIFSSGLTEIEILKDELNTAKKKELLFEICYNKGWPILKSQLNFKPDSIEAINNKMSILYNLANDVSNIDFCIYLHNRGYSSP